MSADTVTEPVTLSPVTQLSGYWEIRKAILDALEAKDDRYLKEIATLHPGVFQNVVNMAKRQTAKRGRRVS